MRKYTGYKFAKTSGKFVRDNYAPNPTAVLGAFGVLGKAIGFLINYLIAKPAHLLTFAVAGRIYDKNNHPAWFGAVMYTVCFFAFMALLKTAISLIIR